MINNELLKVSLREQALYLGETAGTTPPEDDGRQGRELTVRTLALVSEFQQMGYGVSEPLLVALNQLSADDQQTLLDAVNDVMGTHLNWASLTRGWLVPTGESFWDHFITLMANLAMKHGDGASAATAGSLPPMTLLPCGHYIPEGTFDLERYNGCPFCGTPFHTADFVYRGQGTKLKQLQVWGDADMQQRLENLLLSPVPLDATQRESLSALLRHYPLPTDADIVMKETRMLVIDNLLEMDKDAAQLLSSPTDVLRYLWYRHTGHVQIIEPRTLLRTEGKNQRYELNGPTDIAQQVASKREKLKLKYSRQWCRRVANWLNALPMDTDQQLEAMHPKREMWVRMIRALRLAEYARKPGYERLATLMDRFYRKDYVVWQGRVDSHRLKNDAEGTLSLLRQRPGLFARCLFSTMLTFGREPVMAAFHDVLHQVPVRLLLSLGGTADIYFDRSAQRMARPLTGLLKPIPPHPLLVHYTDDELQLMKQSVHQLYLDAMRAHFAATGVETVNGKIFIAPELDDIPVAVGDRSATIQDTSTALQGMRFHVDGDAVRLFLQWGAGLPAQHLDMDLSCYLLKERRGEEEERKEQPAAKEESEVCSYYNLSPEGALHSGDIQRIPDQVGTAEYIELQLPVLEKRGVQRVVFTCNAYTAGALQPNLMVGWMNAEQPMKVSDETGVAYDPSTVQHMVRIAESNLSKGLIFGVLEVSRREIIWLEMPFDGQTVASISADSVEAYLRRLRAKPTIGQLLRLKAEVQHLNTVATPGEATEAYTLSWAKDTAAVSRLLMS